MVGWFHIVRLIWSDPSVWIHFSDWTQSMTLTQQTLQKQHEEHVIGVYMRIRLNQQLTNSSLKLHRNITLSESCTNSYYWDIVTQILPLKCICETFSMCNLAIQVFSESVRLSKKHFSTVISFSWSFSASLMQLRKLFLLLYL